jgi:hypothetical protein
LIGARGAQLRLDPQGTLRCAQPRKKNEHLECHTAIARPQDDVLVIRCRNCGAGHVVRVVDGKLAFESAP